MDPRAPPSHHLLSPAFFLPQLSAASGAAYSLPSTALTYQPSQPPIPTPFPPFQPQFHPTGAATYPSYAATPTVYYAPSSFNAGFPHNPPSPGFPRSHTPHPIHHHSPNDDDHLRRLRNEVIFLHSLWHQGPPDSNPNPSPCPVFTPNPDYNLNFAGGLLGNLHPHLKPSHSAAFKKKKKRNKNPLFRAVSDKPWPVLPEPSAPPASESGWPEFPPRLAPSTPAASEEDSARVSAIRVQQRGIDSFRSFFAGKHGPESESESDDDDQDQDDTFDHQFLEVFEGDQELKGYYLKNFGNGDFLCLVCGGSGQKLGRKYKNCVALIQHTITVSNTKKRAAHRAYGNVICKVLEWDINQLHLVSRNLCLYQGNDMSSAEACKDDPVVVETNISSLANENAQSDPSKATSDVGKVAYPVGVETSISSIFNENAQSDPSKATSDVGKDDGTGKETSDLPLDQQGNGMSSVEACKDDPVGVEPNIALVVSENEQSEPSKATSDVGIDNAAERMETSDLASVLDNPDDQQINDPSNAGASKTYSDTNEEHTVAVAVLNEHGPSDPPKADGIGTGDANVAHQTETSSPAN